MLTFDELVAWIRVALDVLHGVALAPSEAVLAHLGPLPRLPPAIATAHAARGPLRPRRPRARRGRRGWRRET